MENNLEPIFWKNGKFVNGNGKRVNHEQIGSATIIDTLLFSTWERQNEELQNKIPEKLQDLQKKDKRYFGVNAYCLGESNSFEDLSKSQFSKFYQSINYFKLPKKD
ncbi:MAG: hypothetical protein ABIE36_00880 [Candidatus Diapherotrites archaeon]